MPNMLRCHWTVTAGIIPKVPDHGLTRQFVYTDADYDRDVQMVEAALPEFNDPEARSEVTQKSLRHFGESIFMQRQKEAYDYALSIQNPSYLNWVNVVWEWM